MFVAGAYVTITGGAGAATGLAPDIILPWDMHYGEANSPWEVRQVVRKLAHDGVDHIKVLSSGAVLAHGSYPKSQEFTLEELQAAVDEASHFGLRVESHAHSPEGIKNAIRAGVASVEHATLIDDEGIALAKQHGTYLDMDIADDECVQEQGKTGQVPKDMLEKETQLAQTTFDNFRKAVAAGVKMSFGTDAGVCPYGTSGKQFAYHGEVRNDSHAGNSGRNQQRRRPAWPFERIWLDQAGKICGHHCCNRRPAHGHSPAGKCPVRNERRQGLQTMMRAAAFWYS